MAKIYTRTGDKGKTSLVDSSRVSKAHLRIDALGTLDEANATIGFLMALLPQRHASYALLEQTQRWLFSCGARVAEPTEESVLGLQMPGADTVAGYEQAIDAMTKQLPPLTNFILPGGCELAARAHVVRTVVRRAERCLVAIKEADEPIDEDVLKFINRLSDYFFTLARYYNYEAGVTDCVWEPPHLAAS